MQRPVLGQYSISRVGQYSISANSDGEAKVAIDEPRLMQVIGLSKQEARFILSTVIAHQAELLKEWEKIHGKSN